MTKQEFDERFLGKTIAVCCDFEQSKEVNDYLEHELGLYVTYHSWPQCNFTRYPYVINYRGYGAVGWNGDGFNPNPGITECIKIPFEYFKEIISGSSDENTELTSMEGLL